MKKKEPDMVMCDVMRMVNFPKEQFRIALHEVLEKKRRVRNANIDFMPVELEQAQKTIQTLQSNIVDELERCAGNIIKHYTGWKGME